VRFRVELKSPRKVLAGRPGVLTMLVAACAVFGLLTTGAAAWFTYDITAGLPSRDEIAGIGDMAQATTIYDRTTAGLHVFKEQRIEVPLEPHVAQPHQGGPLHRGPAVLRAQRGRRRARGRCGARNIETGRRARRAAAPSRSSSRARAFSAATRRSAQGQGGLLAALHRERVHEGADPRALPEQGVLRRRAVRRGGGLARLLREERHAT
jgi:hypothetical protein